MLLEGRARFDELQNLYWRLHFESSGVKILPLVPNYKVHAKVLSIRHQVRRRSCLVSVLCMLCVFCVLCVVCVVCVCLCVCATGRCHGPTHGDAHATHN